MATSLAASWRSAFSVGVTEIDDQHQQLFDCLDALMSSLNTELSQLQSFEALAQLEHYARTHFCVEECLMRLFEYPDLEAHRAEHELFSTKIEELRTLSLDADVAKPTVGFLSRWLVSHIEKRDAHYAAYLRNRASLDALAGRIGAATLPPDGALEQAMQAEARQRPLSNAG